MRQTIVRRVVVGVLVAGALFFAPAANAVAGPREAYLQMVKKQHEILRARALLEQRKARQQQQSQVQQVQKLRNDIQKLRK